MNIRRQEKRTKEKRKEEKRKGREAKRREKIFSIQTNESRGYCGNSDKMKCFPTDNW
jgi:hypothetical protein